MTEIKRYEMNHRGLPSADHTGTWVLHEDLAAIVAEKDARIAALHEQVRAMAAELAVVEKIQADTIFISDEDFKKCPAIAQKVIKSLAVMVIPSVEEFIREIRAQGVDQFAKHLRSHMQNGSPLNLLAIGAEEFAARIRSGEKL